MARYSVCSLFLCRFFRRSSLVYHPVPIFLSFFFSFVLVSYFSRHKQCFLFRSALHPLFPAPIEQREYSAGLRHDVSLRNLVKHHSASLRKSAKIWRSSSTLAPRQRLDDGAPSILRRYIAVSWQFPIRFLSLSLSFSLAAYSSFSTRVPGDVECLEEQIRFSDIGIAAEYLLEFVSRFESDTFDAIDNDDN